MIFPFSKKAIRFPAMLPSFGKYKRWNFLFLLCCLLLPHVTLPARIRYSDDKVSRAQDDDDVAARGRRPHWVSDIDEMVDRHQGGCILTIDNRSYDPETENVSPFDIFEERGKNLPFYVASRIINRAYARRHGYKFIVGEVASFKDDVSGRHAAWSKVLFIKQQLQCCCQWALFVDSDVYLRMDDHKLSIEHWLRLIDTPGYMSWIEKKFNFSLEEAGQLYLPDKATTILVPSQDNNGLILLAPRNGDPQHAYGKAVPLFPTAKTCERECDFINSGVLLFRNSSLTHKLLDEWWNETLIKRFTKHPWEQPRLSEVVRKYKTHVGVIPYLEATGPDGRQMRHLWVVKNPAYPQRQLEQSAMRQRQMHAAILSIAAMQEEEHLLRSRRRKHRSQTL